MRELTRYKSVQVDGLQIFYREAGPPDATTILLLHGFPSTSRMYEPLFQRLADRYHLIAPDYPGFDHSDAPPSEKFAYTFDNLATIVDHLRKVSMRRRTHCKAPRGCGETEVKNSPRRA